jgi:cobalt/nickel transport system permease protein
MADSSIDVVALGGGRGRRFNARMTLTFDPPPTVASPIARLDPRWKLAGLAMAAAGVAALQSPGSAAVALFGALLLAMIARLPARWYFGRLGTLALALAPFAIIMPLVQGISGVRLAALLAAKAGTIVTLALVAIGTAPLPTTLHAAQSLRLPPTLVHILLLSYRYLFVLADELDRLRRAVRVRGFRPRVDRHTYRTVGHVIGTLVVRGTERADGVAHAMRCRGFDGRFRSLSTFRTRVVDVLFFVVVVAYAAALVVWDR